MRTSRRGRAPLRIGAALLAGTIVAGMGFVIGRHWSGVEISRIQQVLRGIEPSEWHQFARAEVARFEAGRAIVRGSLYVIGGWYADGPKATPRVDALDLATGTWTRKRDMPALLTHANPVVVRDTIWLAGGFEGDHPGTATARVWRYVPATDVWLPGPPLPAPRGGGSLAVLGDTLHFLGGWLPDRTTDSPDHWTLVIGDSTWRPAAPLPVPRGHFIAIPFAGRIYAIGGVLSHDPTPADIGDVHRYDPATNRWDTLASAPFAVSHVENSTFVLDGKLIVVGGRSRPEGREDLDDLLAFDPGTEQWSHLGRLPLPVIGPVGFMFGDILVVGLGATDGIDRFNPLVWQRRMHDVWTRADTMPVALGEVAGGVIGRMLYLVGDGDRHTLVYDLAAGQWGPLTAAAARPAAGDHHAAEVFDGKLWLFGGLMHESAGAVQIYDPVSREWRFGPRMPFAAGSSASALIHGKFYVAGGIVGDTTTSAAAVLDPATMSWSPIAPMPRPRNHAASATDGERLFVFGGRGPGSGGANVVANGFPDVQIYDPRSNSWTVSDGSGNAPKPLPQARGGMGKAVWLHGEFWVIGGETVDGAGATKGHTYTRVDIYDPRRNTWRAGPPLASGRHGIFPVADEGLILIAGGGTVAGTSRSSRLDVIWPLAPIPTP
ncbi:MAG TPA: hypothetical protein VID74_07855 [Gemmatimonadales bacterium]